MQIIQRRFKKCGDEYDTHWKFRFLELCDEGLRELFNFPDEVDTIWISLHDRPAIERLPVKIRDMKVEIDLYLSVPGASSSDTYVFTFWRPSHIRLLRPKDGQVLHVQVEYYEP